MAISYPRKTEWRRQNKATRAAGRLPKGKMHGGENTGWPKGRGVWRW